MNWLTSSTRRDDENFRWGASAAGFVECSLWQSGLYEFSFRRESCAKCIKFCVCLGLGAHCNIYHLPSATHTICRAQIAIQEFQWHLDDLYSCRERWNEWIFCMVSVTIAHRKKFFVLLRMRRYGDIAPWKPSNEQLIRQNIHIIAQERHKWQYISRSESPNRSAIFFCIFGEKSMLLEIEHKFSKMRTQLFCSIIFLKFIGLNFPLSFRYTIDANLTNSF